ncbi:helix-turn-helix domain-containing protein [Rhizobium sp. 11_C7_N12_5]|uniref:helix-turn-helix domain-containing protein n=1 Tax=Rhizobium sp. 11_C7_N12_5 TaxID=3240770 RepID=UPI003F2028E6
MDDDIITIREVAEYLRLKEKTAYALVAKGEIPGFKVGGSWRFRRSELEKWIVRREGNEADRS